MSTKKGMIIGLAASVLCLAAPNKPFYAIGSDGGFIVMAAEADMTIAHIGKEAEDRASADKVKDFGKTLVLDHTADYQHLTELASKAQDVIPKAIDRPNDRVISSLNHYSGKAFDHAFLTRQSEEYDRLIRAFKHEAEHGSNPQIKAYAAKALPIIERDLHQAQDLLGHRL